MRRRSTAVGAPDAVGAVRVLSAAVLSMGLACGSGASGVAVPDEGTAGADGPAGTEISGDTASPQPDPGTPPDTGSPPEIPMSADGDAPADLDEPEDIREPADAETSDGLPRDTDGPSEPGEPTDEGGPTDEGPASDPGPETVEPAPPTHFELAEHWAPVWYHDSDDTDYAADYIVAFDFDGDTVSANNWENLHTAKADLSAVIYWSMVETATHWFITYTDFHPRDWTEDCDTIFGEPCHENDMEGAMVVVRKADETPFGTFEVLYTEAHNTLHIFMNDPSITAASTSDLESEPVTFEGGSHPELYVESKGHGVCALYYDGKGHCKHPTAGTPPPFPGGDGLVYRYKGVAETPSSGNDQDVGYALLPFEDTIWPLRTDICDGGCTFDTTMTYDGVTVAKAFDGDTWGKDKANPPWAWDDPDDGPVFRGDFFFRPAKTLVTHLNIGAPVSQEYLVNPYLFDL